MDYKRFDQTVILRVDRGEELLACLEEVCAKEDIRLASVSGIGACDKAVVGLYNVEEQRYHKIHIVGEREITALQGNISTMDGDYYAHLHITLSDGEGKATGGHLNECHISGTSEIFIQQITATIDRKKDPITGLNIIDF